MKICLKFFCRADTIFIQKFSEGHNFIKNVDGVSVLLGKNSKGHKTVKM